VSDFYFRQFEDRRPPDPVPYSAPRELLWQYLAVMNLILGAWYISWRWGWSLNHDALWFAIPLVMAETCAYFGLILFTINLWKIRDTPPQAPPRFIAECLIDADAPHRPVAVDVMFTTYNEDPEIVRLSIADARKLRYPHAIDLRIHVLDDGRRDAMRKVAEEEGVNYIARASNIGFKAGNLRNGLEQTGGDFIVICDADTRPFPTLLERTLGYFRDPDVAWVQSPQWFYDIPEGTPLPDRLARTFGSPGRALGKLVEAVFGRIRAGADPFGSDPALFYDAIQRRRNWANASFCCGAGSIHRREAVMRVSLRRFSDSVASHVGRFADQVSDPQLRSDLAGAMTRQLALETELTPYKFHVSEDIYTSIVLHEDRERTWKSVYHPLVETRMLSPQDLLTVTIQRFKYAGGTLDITLHDNPLFRAGLRWPQRLMYGATMWSYLAVLWNVVFLAAPLIYLFTGIAPVSAYSWDFYKHSFPFLMFNELAFMIGLWGMLAWQGQCLYLALFPSMFKALVTVLRDQKISFAVTPKLRQAGVFYALIRWQAGYMILMASALVYGGVRLWTGASDNTSGWLINVFWGLNNILAMSGVVRSAFWKPEDAPATPAAAGPDFANLRAAVARENQPDPVSVEASGFETSGGEKP
jgi:cellulose synthase (UDP-forming)